MTGVFNTHARVHTCTHAHTPFYLVIVSVQAKAGTVGGYVARKGGY